MKGKAECSLMSVRVIEGDKWERERKRQRERGEAAVIYSCLWVNGAHSSPPCVSMRA